MAGRAPNSRLLIAASAALGVSLLVIAFLLGRESGRSSVGDGATVAHVLPPVPRLANEAESPSETSIPVDPWLERNDDYRYADTHWGEVDGIDQRPDGTIVLSNTRDGHGSAHHTVDAPSAKRGPEPRDERAAVTAYLAQVDLLRSNAGAGNPNAFAMEMIKAGMGGATSGFDRLIDDTDRMSKDLASLSPPPSCVPYHQATLQSLEEASELLEDMKVAIKKYDLQTLTTIAPRAARLQEQAEALKALREAMLASLR